MSTRIGSIYALQQLVADSAEVYRPVVVRTLSAFVTANAGGWSSMQDELNNSDETRMDIQVGLSVLGEVALAPKCPVILRDVYLPSAELKLARLEGMQFSGSLWLAELQGARLSRAQMPYAHLGKADLTGADFSEANLSSTWLVGAVMTGANFAGADLTNANLEGARADLADFRGAVFLTDKLVGIRLEGAQYNDATRFLPSVDPSALGMVKQ